MHKATLIVFKLYIEQLVIYHIWYSWIYVTIDYIDSVPGIVYREYFKGFLRAVSVVLINTFVWVVGISAADEEANKKVDILIECLCSTVVCILDGVQVSYNSYPVVSWGEVKLLDFIRHHFHKFSWITMVWGSESSKTTLFASLVFTVWQLIY